MDKRLDYKERIVNHELIKNKRKDVLQYLTGNKIEKEILEIYDKLDELIDDRIILIDKYQDLLPSQRSETYEKIMKIKSDMNTLFEEEFEIFSSLLEVSDNIKFNNMLSLSSLFFSF